MFPHENGVSLRFYDTCSLKRAIGCNSDNWVETVKILRNTCILLQHHVLNVFLFLLLYFQCLHI